MIKNKFVLWLLDCIFKAIMQSKYSRENWKLAGWILGNTPAEEDERK